MIVFEQTKAYLRQIRDHARAATRYLTPFAYRPMCHPTFSASTASDIAKLPDVVRYSALALAIQRLELEQIDGAFAELGVYRGLTSSFLHRQAPGRRLYLFDTFAGFPEENLEVNKDARFRNTSSEVVAKRIGDLTNVIFRVGCFPESAAGLEHERFALIMLDFDLYQSAIDSFRFFYPRLVPGGYFFLHDFNNPESNHGISRAAAEFLRDKPELLFEIPDLYGSAVFRKLR